MSARTKYQRCVDYVEPYSSEAWGYASGHAWDRLNAIASEYERGEYEWPRAKELLDDTQREVEEGEQHRLEELEYERRDIDHEPDQYWSGTGELMSDDSYIDYLNRS